MWHEQAEDFCIPSFVPSLKMLHQISAALTQVGSSHGSLGRARHPLPSVFTAMVGGGLVPSAPPCVSGAACSTVGT